MNRVNSPLRARFYLSRRHSCLWIADHFRSNKYSFLFPLGVAFFLTLWHSRATHHFSLKALLVFVFLCGLSLIYGRLFTRLTSISLRTGQRISLRFLCGYFCVSTLLFLLLIFTPLTIATNVFILCGGVPFILLFLSRTRGDRAGFVDHLPDFLCLIISGLGATLWCADSLSGLVNEGAMMISRTFTDTFFHAREISAIAQAHGLMTLSDVRMAGVHAPIYHYASYLVPAALSSLTGSTAYTMFVSFLVPFGILLTGLAAFALASSIWGIWPGLAATVAIILLPDAYQQGFGNKFLGYNFIQQAAPSGLYGVAFVAVAWIFMLEGCKKGKLAPVLIGYAVSVITIVYKAQFFVANAFLIMIYPCLFLYARKASWRIVIAILLVSLFLLVVSLTRHLESIPTLRLDGSGAVHYAAILLYRSEPGFLKSFFDGAVRPHLRLHSNSILVPYLASMIVLWTFGFWTLLCALVLFFSRRLKIGAAAAFFPIFVFVNYTVISLGLAMDEKGIGSQVELLHRPFVWAYFALAAWTGAGTYAVLFGDRPPRAWPARILAAICVFSGLGVFLAYAHNIQTVPYVPDFDTYRSFNSIPTHLVKACADIREHSALGDIIQDSENDHRFVVTGLAERQDFAAAADSRFWEGVRVPQGLLERLDKLETAKQISDEGRLREFMHAAKISWYVLQPESNVAWPRSVLDKPAFRSGNYRVYHFTP